LSDPDLTSFVIRCLRARWEPEAPEDARAGDSLTYENEVMVRKEGGKLRLLLELHWSLFDSTHHQR
jgi:hypothetical protein